jgi:hypothetical protein
MGKIRIKRGIELGCKKNKAHKNDKAARKK